MLNKAKNFFYNKNYVNAKNIFADLGMNYEAGLCELLLNNIDSAKKYWYESENDSFASLWGRFIISIIEKEPIQFKPKYFQIRAFYEIYISLFIENNQFEYANKLINACEYLTRFNLEVPKFIARVLHSYNYDNEALSFVELSLRENYIDIEALFISAQIHLKNKNYKKSKEDIDKILEIAPTYYPALNLKNIMASD